MGERDFAIDGMVEFKLRNESELKKIDLIKVVTAVQEQLGI